MLLFHFSSKKQERTVGRDPFNQHTDRSDREKRTTSKGPVFSKLFRLDRTDPLSFEPKFPEILVEWIAPVISGADLLGRGGGVGIGPGLGLGLGKTFKVKFHKNCEKTIFIPEEIHQASEDKQSI